MVQRAITPAVLTFHDWPWQAWASHKPEQTALFDSHTALNWQQVCEQINHYSRCLPENPPGKSSPLPPIPVLKVFTYCWR